MKSFEIISDTYQKAMKTSKPLITKTTLNLLNCIRKKGPKDKDIMSKPTKQSHPELFQARKICEITPLDLCDRLNLELGIVKIKQANLILDMLGTQSLDLIRKTMIILRIRKIIDTLKNSLVIERRDTVLSLVDTVAQTKKGSKPFRKLLHMGDKTNVKPWETINNLYQITTKPGNDYFFARAYKFWRNKYLNLEQQKFHLFNINNRLRYNVHLSKYLKNDDGTYHDDKCTTCVLSGVMDAARENGHHLYIDCFKAKEIATHIIETFNLQLPIHDEEIIFFSNHDDYWERLKRNIIFLEFKIHLNKCRRVKTIPNKEDVIRAIQKRLLMVFTTNPMDNSLIDGLLPLVSGVGLSREQTERILFRSNNSPTISKLMFESQRRNTFLATKTSSNLIVNSVGIGAVAKRIQTRFAKTMQH